jgi:hypothetical protein
VTPSEKEERQKEVRRLTAQTLADLVELSQAIDETIHDTVSTLAAVKGILLFLVEILRRLAARLERELDAEDAKDRGRDAAAPGQ